MRLFESKRGNETQVIMEPPLVMAIVFGVIFLTLLGFISKISVSNYYENTYIASYGGVTLQTTYPASGILMFDSNLDTMGLTLNFLNGKAESHDDILYEGATEQEKAYYWFTGDPTIDIIEGLVAPKFKTVEGKKLLAEKSRLRFLKQGNEVSVGTPDTIEPNFNKLTCPKFEKIKEYQVPIFVKDKRELDRAELRNLASRSPALILVTKDTSYKNDVVVAYISSSKVEESKAMSCAILDKILSDNSLNKFIDVSDVVIIPTDEFPILDLGNFVVLLEFRTEASIENEIANIGQLVENAIT